MKISQNDLVKIPSSVQFSWLVPPFRKITFIRHKFKDNVLILLLTECGFVTHACCCSLLVFSIRYGNVEVFSSFCNVNSISRLRTPVAYVIPFL